MQCRRGGDGGGDGASGRGQRLRGGGFAGECAAVDAQPVGNRGTAAGFRLSLPSRRWPGGVRSPEVAGADAGGAPRRLVQIVARRVALYGSWQRPGR